MNLRAIDLNLLVVFHSLMATRNVTAAAKAMGMTQPAMSNCLSRLRQMLGDQLLVRSSQGMVATPRALDLIQPVTEILKQLDRTLFEPPVFVPSTAKREFVVGSTDYGGLVVAPMLAKALSEQAPGIVVTGRPLRQVTPLKELATEMDLALGFELPPLDGLFGKVLYVEDYVAVVRRDHPRIKKRLTLAAYLELRHVLVAPFLVGPGVVDIALEKLGHTRKVAMRIHTFLLAPLIVAQTDYVVTIPRKIAEAASSYMPIQLFEPPLEVKGFPVSVSWHERMQDDPGHRFLRELILGFY